MGRIRRWIPLAIAAVGLTVCGALVGLSRGTDARTREIPFATAFAGRKVGADWAERNGVAGEPVVGEIDDFDVFAREDFAAGDVHTEIRRFYERTAEYDMAYTVRWHRGFRVGAWLAAFLTTRHEQLNLPGRTSEDRRRLASSLARVPEDVDPRDSVVWTRTDPEGGEAVFVAIYATHDHDGVTYANVAVPLPGCNLSTVLRPEAIEGAAEGTGVAFTTDGPGDGGLYLVTPLGPLDVPMSQSFRVWPAGAAGAPESPVADADLVATHEMWLAGRQFLTITYGIARSAADRSAE